MQETVFLAGAAGVIGRCLAPMLVAQGWRVVGTTRTADKADVLRAAGVEAVVVDVYDADALDRAVHAASPAIVIHQLTDLPRNLDPARIDQARVNNARLREIGTRHLVAAAVRWGTRRMIAQSISFAYAPGPTPYDEERPLDTAAPGSVGASARGAASLERQVLAAPLHAIVLRYGRLYGPGTGVDAAPKGGPLHVEQAASAACLALTRGEPGIYNIAEDDGTVDVSKAARGLGT